MTEPEKKKRRQNVACDSCRLRRVKCDMLALLTADRPDGSGPVPPLHILVRENPGIACSKCIGKGIRCTTNQIVNPAKPNKGGRRIEEAKRMFGGDGSVPLQTDDSSRSSSNTSAPTPLPLAAQYDTLPPTTPQYQSTSLQLLDPSALFPSGDPSLFSFLPQYDPSLQPQLSGSISPGIASPSVTSAQQMDGIDWNNGSFNPSFHSQLAGDISTLMPQGLEPWSETTQPANPLSLDQADFPMPVTGVTPPMPSSGLDPLVDPRLSTSSFIGPSTSYHYLDVKWKGGAGTDFRVAPDIYRPASELLRRDESVAQSMAVVPMGGNVVAGRKRDFEEDDQDPWNVKLTGDGQLIQWGRREAVGEGLADRALGHQLSRHLVGVYFTSVHLNLPTISPEAFYMDWQKAGQRSDRMKPAQEALCAVVEAWAARFSDHPVILGLDKSQAHLSPKVITDGGTFVPGTAARSRWGQARLKICAGLLKRARQMIDIHSLMTKPSITGLQALTLYSQLHHMSDQEETSEVIMERGMLHSIVVEQMQQLGMNWSANSDILVTSEEPPLSSAMLRVKQRRLFWTIIVADSLWAAAAGMPPKLLSMQPIFADSSSDEDVEASGEWLGNVDEALAPSTFKTLSFFMSAYHRCSVIGRMVARKIAIPAKRPGAVAVNDFCVKARSIWRDIRNVYRDLNLHGAQLLVKVDDDLLGFSPIHSLSGIRNTCVFLAMVLHWNVRALRDFHNGLREACIHTASSSPESQHESPSDKLLALEDLLAQSTDSTLAMCRAQVPMFKELLATGLLQSASMMMRVLVGCSRFLAEAITVEQGYPNDTPGGSGWTWQAKQEAIASCVEALHQQGWAWADVGPAIEEITLAMERLQPTPEQLVAFASQPSNANTYRFAKQRVEEDERDSAAVTAALRFWPPVSVSRVVESWSKEEVNRVTNGQHEETPLSYTSAQESQAYKSGRGLSFVSTPASSGPSSGEIPSITVLNDEGIPTDRVGNYFADVKLPPRKLAVTPSQVWYASELPMDEVIRVAQAARTQEQSASQSHVNAMSKGSEDVGDTSELEKFLEQLAGDDSMVESLFTGV